MNTRVKAIYCTLENYWFEYLPHIWKFCFCGFESHCRHTFWVSELMSLFGLYEVNLCSKIFKSEIRSMIQTVKVFTKMPFFAISVNLKQSIFMSFCSELLRVCYDIQCLAKTWIYLTAYLYTERIFESQPFIYNKIFWKKLLQKMVLYASLGTFCVHIWSIIQGTMSLWKMFEKGQIAFEGKCRQFRILPKV